LQVIEHIPNNASSSRSIRMRLQWTLIPLMGLIILATALDRTAADPLLVGRWEWSPDPVAGSPLQLNGDGSGQLMMSVGCFSFPQSCRWSVENDELQLYSSPQLDNLTFAGVQSYVASLWQSHVTSPEPSRRYRIVERTGAELRLQPLSSDGSAADEPIETYRRSVEF
jgi:hypothetical protein